ncbi:unnamed protein product, partial [Larinioides sclopetarius]
SPCNLFKLTSIDSAFFGLYKSIERCSYLRNRQRYQRGSRQWNRERWRRRLPNRERWWSRLPNRERWWSRLPNRERWWSRLPNRERWRSRLPNREWKSCPG